MDSVLGVLADGSTESSYEPVREVLRPREVKEPAGKQRRRVGPQGPPSLPRKGMRNQCGCPLLKLTPRQGCSSDLGEFACCPRKGKLPVDGIHRP